ncbi:MAG: saccharopine dehydrogenase [Cytophagales bacterium]|nr:MAG: saccharopine dehydrogenase [Cytophagales bacterium]
MKNILLIGCGRSSVYLLQWLEKAENYNNLKTTICDYQSKFTYSSLFPLLNTKYISLDIADSSKLAPLIKSANIVISMLPANLHYGVALQCLEFSKHFITASYLSQEIKALHEKVKSKGLIFMMEAGLDPGLDHLSAKKEIDEIHQQSGQIISFKSSTGGLVAPENDNNPWHYKISWNPRNVVMAGNGGAKYLHNGKEKFTPYQRLFKTTYPISVFESEDYEAYPNRDSLNYKSIYHLEEAETLLRGTIRKKGFCNGWHQLVWLGMTDDNFIIENSEGMPLSDFTKLFIPEEFVHENLKESICKFLNLEESSIAFQQLESLGLFSSLTIKTPKATPAQVLQELLLYNIPLREKDKDMVIMQHEILYKKKEILHLRKSSLIIIGEDESFTAMAKTVGIPIIIIAKMILNNDFFEKGVLIPISKNIYIPVLREAENYGITFQIIENTEKKHMP